jgi:hypothetical protein
VGGVGIEAADEALGFGGGGEGGLHGRVHFRGGAGLGGGFFGVARKGDAQSSDGLKPKSNRRSFDWRLNYFSAPKTGALKFGCCAQDDSILLPES